MLVDGTFCHAALQNQVNIREQLSRLFDDKIKLYTTPCVITELQRMGSVVYGALLIVKQFVHYNCQHSDLAETSAAKCILSIIKAGNKQRFCLASQDTDLRQQLSLHADPVPVLYLHGTAPTLQRPSQLESDVASHSLQARTGIDSFQHRAIGELKKQLLGKKDESKPRRKVKRVKGPNPLSCKKSKRKPTIAETTPASTTRKRSRKKRVRIAAHVREEMVRRQRTSGENPPSS